MERPTSEIVSSLSNDQRYLLEISLACQQGPEAFDKNKSLASRSPGALNHSRWLTRANRVLRLYVSSPEPSPQLSRMVQILLNTYCQGFINGPRAFHEIVKTYERTLTLEEQDVVEPVLSRNNFFGNPENVLMSMLYDRQKSTRRRAVLAIHLARDRAKSSNGIRKFKVFPVNMKASNYYDLVNWKMTESIHEPPWTIKYSNEDIAVQIENPSHIPIPHAPFHTQSVERHVKLVSEVSSRVSGFKKRHYEILNILYSRKEMAKFDSKKMFPIKNLEP